MYLHEFKKMLVVIFTLLLIDKGGYRGEDGGEGVFPIDKRLLEDIAASCTPCPQK